MKVNIPLFFSPLLLFTVSNESVAIQNILSLRDPYRESHPIAPFMLETAGSFRRAIFFAISSLPAEQLNLLSPVIDEGSRVGFQLTRNRKIYYTPAGQELAKKIVSTVDRKCIDPSKVLTQDIILMASLNKQV